MNKLVLVVILTILIALLINNLEKSDMGIRNIISGKAARIRDITEERVTTSEVPTKNEENILRSFGIRDTNSINNLKKNKDPGQFLLEAARQGNTGFKKR